MTPHIYTLSIDDKQVGPLTFMQTKSHTQWRLSLRVLFILFRYAYSSYSLIRNIVLHCQESKIQPRNRLRCIEKLSRDTYPGYSFISANNITIFWPMLFWTGCNLCRGATSCQEYHNSGQDCATHKNESCTLMCAIWIPLHSDGCCNLFIITNRPSATSVFIPVRTRAQRPSWNAAKQELLV